MCVEEWTEDELEIYRLMLEQNSIDVGINILDLYKENNMRLIESHGDGLIGIWWYTLSKEIIGVSKHVDEGVVDNNYIQYDDKDNHSSLWTQVIRNNYKEPNASKIISKGYKAFERGCVIYNILTQCYEITCSSELVNDRQFRHKIVEYFNLKSDRKDFVPLNHYHKYELTGNPTLDDLEYGI